MEWFVPITEGAYPTFDARASETQKKKDILAVIVRETDIKVVKATANLLKAQFIKAIQDCYIRELHEGDHIEYNDRSLFELLDHINKKYAKMDSHILKANRITFAEPPDIDDPIDNYFSKQENCKRVAKSSNSPITNDDLVTTLLEHMGKTGVLPKSTIKFNKKEDSNRTWKNAKDWYRDALDDIDEGEKLSGVDKELQANGAVQNQEDVMQEARDEVAT